MRAQRRRAARGEEDRLAERVFADSADIGAGTRRLVLGGCAAVLVAVAYIDYRVGFEISFSLFYLFPMAAATWYGARGAGIAFAFVGAALWAVSDQMSDHAYSHPAVPYWNAGVRLAYFLIVVELISRLEKLLARERRESETDALTGVFNRSGWFEAVEIELARARRNGYPVAVAYIDLDDFKRVNDSSGHAEGDRVLNRVALTLRHAVRRSDVLARLGGDEFAVFLANVEPDVAKRLCDKLHRRLSAEIDKRRWPVGVSIGVAAFREPPVSVQEIVTEADHAMYRAKRDGKNKVHLGR
jgi:diguanylate cyclase (GGDEF)-like protein